MTTLRFYLSACFLLASVGPVLGAAPPTASEVVGALDVGQLREQILRRPASAGDQLTQSRVDLLIAANRLDLVSELRLLAIELAPYDTTTLEKLQVVFIKAQLRKGNAQEALSQARSLFNVARLESTGEVLLLVQTCLQAANPRDVTVSTTFMREQMAGAELRKAGDTPIPSPLLQGIVVDALWYDEVLEIFPGDTDQSLLARGNLLLLANRPTEAKEVFEQLLAKATPAKKLECHKNIARAIRAIDGNIGRANGYLVATVDPESPLFTNAKKP